MRTLILSFISILSLGAYGQEIPNFSFTGLEGLGKKAGIYIVVEDYSKLDKSFDAKAIKTKVELKLRLAGIKIAEKISPDCDSIYIECLPISQGRGAIGYAVTISPRRDMKFEYAGKVYTAPHTSTKSYSGLSSPSTFLQNIDKFLDELLVDYLKANPKKE